MLFHIFKRQKPFAAWMTLNMETFPKKYNKISVIPLLVLSLLHFVTELHFSTMIEKSPILLYFQQD